MSYIIDVVWEGKGHKYSVENEEEENMLIEELGQEHSIEEVFYEDKN